jgi:hypothetical protein
VPDKHSRACRLAGHRFWAGTCPHEDEVFSVAAALRLCSDR